MHNKKILIVKNITHEDAGLFGDILNENNIPYDVVDLSLGKKFPNPKNYAAVMVFGGPDSANDDTEKMKQELQRIKETIDAGIPYLGICLGMQTLVKAAGGNVRKNEVKELGCRDAKGNHFEINLTEEGKNDAIFNGLNNKLNIFHLHGETVDLTPNMSLLAIGKYCKNQAVKIGKNAYGLQGHFELTEEKLRIWMAKDADLKKLDSNSAGRLQGFKVTIRKQCKKNIYKFFGDCQNNSNGGYNK